MSKSTSIVEENRNMEMHSRDSVSGSHDSLGTSEQGEGTTVGV